MTLTDRRALPRISFEAAPAPLDESLPRMDVAAFVGIAASGPMHVPVAVEDVERFRDVFGRDPALARAPADGIMHRAYLGGAVEAFFRNGGKRAWVVRAGDGEQAETNALILPGVVAPPGGGRGWRLAALAARSPGSWSDDLRAGTVLQVEASPALAIADGEVQLDRSVDVVAGDLLRLDFGDGLEALVVAATVLAGEDGVAVAWGEAWWIDTRPDLASVPAGTASRLTTGEPEAVELLGVGEADPASPPGREPDGRRTVLVPDGSGLAPGDMLAVAVPDADLLLAVGNEAGGSSVPGQVQFELEAAWLITTTTPDWFGSLPGGFPPVAEVVRLDVLAWRGEQLDARLGGLGLAAGHPRWLGDLPDDRELFARAAGLPRYPDGAGDMGIGDFAAAELPPLWQDASGPRFPFAAGPAPAGALLPLGAGFAPDPLAAGPRPAADPNTRLARDGVADFGASLFVDPDLARHGVDTLTDAAFHKAYVSDSPDRLLGIHSLLPIDEVTLLVVPDAVHPGWDPVAAPPPIVLGAPELAEPGVAEGGCELSWTAVPHATGYELEQALDPGFGAPDTVTTAATSLTKREFPFCPATYHFRVRAARDRERGPWSNVVSAHLPAATFMPCPPGAAPPPDEPEAGAPAPDTAEPPHPRVEWELREHPADDVPAELLALHTAMLRMCAARGDVMALLAVPAEYRADRAAGYAGRLRRSVPEFDAGGSPAEHVLLPGKILPLGGGEARALSYGALYHPWIVTGIPGVADGLRARPPLGAMAGVYAARALRRGAWIAPANEPLAGVLALEPAPEPGDPGRLAARSINTFERTPRGFSAADQLTLGAEAALRPINVRRLLILLRRLARREGDTYVFRPHDAQFRRLVRMRFERLLAGMFHRGAFAGATPAEAYRVVTDEAVNPPGSVAAGRLVVEIQVAPSRPMEFIRVRLVMTGPDQLSVGEA